MRIERLRDKYDIDVQFVHFPLHPDTPSEGLTLEELFAGRNIDIAASQQRMKGLMEDEGLPYGERTMTYNSRLAQELAKYAETVDGSERIHDRLFRAYFVEGTNLASIDALIAIGTDIGLDETACRDVLEQRRFREEVDADWNRARVSGLTGVPAFVVDRRGVVGAQPLEALEQFVEQAGARRRAATRENGSAQEYP